MSEETPAAFDPRALRDAFGAFITGVTVVTTHDGDGKPIGFTANSFTSVSLDPPLLLVCLAKTSRNYENVTKAIGFAVNVLSEGQKDISNTFARPVEDRFAAVDWNPGPVGSPVFTGAAAWFDCTTESLVDAGDHVVLLGRVGGFENSGLNGLGYARGSYFTPALAARAIEAAGAPETRVSAVVERDGAVLLVREASGRYALPGCSVGNADPVRALSHQVVAETGLSSEIGFLFAVYEDRTTKTQNIVYRATAADAAPTRGEFFPISALPLDQLATPQTGDILRRFATESEIGNFGVYVGNESAGHVHPLARKA